jgi:hypothetical protein
VGVIKGSSSNTVSLAVVPVILSALSLFAKPALPLLELLRLMVPDFEERVEIVETLLLGAGERGAGRDEAREGELRMVGDENELDCRREADEVSRVGLMGSSRERRYGCCCMAVVESAS